VNTVVVSFSTVMGQLTEMSQRKNKPRTKVTHFRAVQTARWS